ncbi:MAG: hypothetical protein ACI4E1_12285 [Lachnospira sp.]
MNEYVKQAQDFLTSCNATMQITYTGISTNKDWDDKKLRNTYSVTITTPKGSMKIKFWDSIYNTEHAIKPTEYDILACLEKYDVGTIDDFVSEFGFEVHKWADVKRIENTYKAVVKEYQDICRCFTPEQIEAMQEIQ